MNDALTSTRDGRTVEKTIREAAGVLLEVGSVAEVRILDTPKRTVSGYFDSWDALAAAVATWDGEAPAIYCTLNPVLPALLARAVNRLKPYAALTTSDSDILRRRWLPLDLDPVRPSGVSSTDGEHEAALARARTVRDWLAGGGWPDPVLLDSGNGAHALYPVDLPNDADALQLVTRCLEALAFHFSDAAVSVDVKVANAARIWKLPGTMACKGDSTPERPHRRARILESPSHLICVPRDLLQGLAAQLPKAENNGHKPGGPSTFALPAWIAAHGLRVATTGPWNGGTKWTLSPCPWNADHTNRSAYIVQHSSGAIAAGCHHNGCHGKGWQDLRDLVEPGWRGRRDTKPEPPAAAVVNPEPTATPDLTVPDAGMIGLARDFAELYAKYLESPLSFFFFFFFFAFLTYFGALVAKMVTLQSELRPEPRLYAMLLGDSADTRKSTALRKADHFVKTLGPEWQPAVLLGVGSAEGLAAALKDQPDHSLLLHLDEAKSFVDKAKAESSVLLPMVTTLFERHEYDNRTKEGSVSVRDVSLTLLAACTQDTYATMFDPRFFSIGFLNRLFLVADHTTVKIPIPQPIPANALAALRTDVLDCLRGIKLAYERNAYQPVAYEMTPGAVEAYRAWYEARTGSVFERRLDTYGHRLMVLLTATTGRTEVDEDVMSAVLALLRYQLDARRECDPVDCDNAVATLEERIRRALARGPMRGRDLQRKLHTERVGVWMWKTAVQNILGTREMCWDRKQDIYRLTGGSVPTFVPTPMGTLK